MVELVDTSDWTKYRFIRHESPYENLPKTVEVLDARQISANISNPTTEGIEA